MASPAPDERCIRQYALVPRIRNEFRLALAQENRLASTLPPGSSCRPPSLHDRNELAHLLLDAYRETIDDEGETITEALQAIDDYLQRILPQYSLVAERDGSLVAMAFTVVVRGTHYIDPVATASAYKRNGIGAATVSAVLELLADDDIVEVGAVITDGNVPSERLFSRLGFERFGEWR